jgi:hypothetical protein
LRERVCTDTGFDFSTESFEPLSNGFSLLSELTFGSKSAVSGFESTSKFLAGGFKRNASLFCCNPLLFSGHTLIAGAKPFSHDVLGAAKRSAFSNSLFNDRLSLRQ